MRLFDDVVSVKEWNKAYIHDLLLLAQSFTGHAMDRDWSISCFCIHQNIFSFAKCNSASPEIPNINRPPYRVTGLKPHHNYEFRVVAVNTVGRGPPSNPLFLTTGELAPDGPPRNVRSRPVSPTTIIVQWDPPQFPNGQILVSIDRGMWMFATAKQINPESMEKYSSWNFTG